MLSCAAGRMSQTHEWGALLLSVRVSPLCVRPRVRRGGGETVSPHHRAFCLGAERSVASVTTRAGAAVEGQRAASIVQKSCVEKGFTERCAPAPARWRWRRATQQTLALEVELFLNAFDLII